MSRWNELMWTLVFDILLARLCLFVLLPGLVLLAVLGRSHGVWMAGGLSVCFLVFGVSVAANLSISRYLRFHETPQSPYTYAYWYDAGRSSRYFRIQVSDKEALRRLLRELRRDHPREAVGRWLWVDEAVYAPPILLVLLVSALFGALGVLVQFAGRKLHPAERG